jgi:nucleotide-binding universal stress UspA family protein
MSSATQARPVVVVGYDGSPSSRLAAEYAIKRALPQGRVVVVHAYDLPPHSVGGPYYETMLHSALEEAKKLMLELREQHPVLQPEDCEVVFGFAAEAICSTATRQRADEIVIGSRGTSERSLLLGGVAHEVTQRASCPVIVIPAQMSAMPADPADAEEVTVS